MTHSATQSNPILVTGATGRHGNTGEHVVRRLRDEGHRVRVLAREISDRTELLESLGAEVVVGDLHQRRTLAAALTDVDLAYFTYPVAPGVVPAAANFAAAVREADRQPRVVVMSMGPAHPDHPSELGRNQWLAEQVLQWAGLDVLILRVVALFHENLEVLHARSVHDEGVIRNSFGDSAIGWISGRDAAELAVAAMLHPQRFDGPVVFPPGPESFTHAQIAELLGDVLGRPVRFEAVSADRWRRELEGLGDGVINHGMAQHISSVGEVIARSGQSIPADPQKIRDLIKREPISLREFLTARTAAFRAVSP
ncbi:NmrA family NAD(P)-binding protein [Nocardia stercoris]|uniref:NAD-dependent epimerase/dehydratase family protein n=1 Tax=Nocardia stercoris TaxID=2483361 RepID=A0A3M2L342_9NOCA|nr:NmrA family NAD(P)-binding protein [Nocardia stercoris]RMI28938.1 NAD-dependent epimerase/dehydratase family protein [Nocardia stercoris]